VNKQVSASKILSAFQLLSRLAIINGVDDDDDDDDDDYDDDA